MKQGAGCGSAGDGSFSDLICFDLLEMQYKALGSQHSSGVNTINSKKDLCFHCGSSLEQKLISSKHITIQNK